MLLEKIKKNIFLVAAILLTILAILPLFHFGLFPIHDNEQVGRLYELDQALRAGQFPVRIIQELGFGYGYLLFNYYPPFIYYFGEVFRFLTFSYVDSIKIVMASGFILSAVFMYLFVKELYGKIAGVLSSVFYVYAPYHAVDLYVRGALPEFFSFAFIPAIFWSYLMLSREKSKKYVVLASLFNFLLLITHNLVGLMASVFIGLYVLFLLYSSKERKKFSIDVLLTLIFSFLLSSFFILPALFENKYTMVSLLTTELANYKIHYVSLIQFWNSPWGYGGSTQGLSDGLSFKLGKLHVLLSVVSILTALYLVFKKKIHKEIFLFIFMLFISLFMQTSYSGFIWDHLSPLSYIQFPWRYLLFSAFFMAILIGFLFSQIKNNKISIVLSLIVISYLLFQSRLIFKPQYFLNNSDKDYIMETYLKWDTSKMAFEYVPNGISTKKSLIGNTIVNINQNQIAKTSYSIISGKMSVSIVKDIPQRKTFLLDVAEPGNLIINEFAYPGWVVSLDGKKVSFDSNNKLKLISVNVPVGRHTLDARFENTTLRNIANILSIIGIILLALYILPRKFNKNVKN